MPEIPVAAAVLLLLLEVVAVAVRISFDSSFVIMHDHERVIVESMRISHMESHASSNPKVDSQYKDLYERIEAYFEMAKPYLDGSLTINDIVKVVYSNKVYISKAICHYTGRNFRQFVNYYRVMYSMDHFRANPELKVSELAERCGFNTVVSYTMAFRLFMNETPSEWCRKERAKILKTKK
jgi:YesN/AraC family two-component response regulator